MSNSELVYNHEEKTWQTGSTISTGYPFGALKRWQPGHPGPTTNLQIHDPTLLLLIKQLCPAESKLYGRQPTVRAACRYLGF